jgi:hypothetical protein
MMAEENAANLTFTCTKPNGFIIYRVDYNDEANGNDSWPS